MVEGAVTQNIGPQQMRLARSIIDVDSSQKSWIYQIRYSSGGPWHDVYCFDNVEFLPQDFGVMSFWTSTNPKSWMTTKIVSVKMIGKGNEIVGKYTLDDGTVKQYSGGEPHVVVECRNEGERIAALDEYFGIILNDEEIRSIKGRNTELHAQK